MIVQRTRARARNCRPHPRRPGGSVIPNLPGRGHGGFGNNTNAAIQLVHRRQSTYEELRNCGAGITLFELGVLREDPRISGQVRSDYNETTPQIAGIRIDRNRATAISAVSSSAIGKTPWQVLLGSRKATTYLDRGREYDVILQAIADDRRRRPPTSPTSMCAPTPPSS